MKSKKKPMNLQTEKQKEQKHPLEKEGRFFTVDKYSEKLLSYDTLEEAKTGAKYSLNEDDLDAVFIYEAKPIMKVEASEPKITKL